jgi:DNA-binding SARP family transcriptional activator
VQGAAGTVVLRQQPDPADPTRVRHQLNPDVIEVDLWRLQDAVVAAGTAIDPPTRLRALRGVVDASGGELADGYGYDWLHPFREAARRRVLDAYVALAEAEPDHAIALGLLQDAIRQSPHTEPLYQAAMRRHAAAGDLDAVGHTVATLTEQLRRVHQEPSRAALELAAQLVPVSR